MDRSSLLLLAAVGVGCTRTAPPETTPSSTANWVSIAQSKSVDVSVERALFEHAGSKRFFVHVRMTNRSDAALGVDLGQRTNLFHPNQWGASTLDHRTAIDERRMVRAALSTNATTKINGEFRAGRLTALPARGAVDYYVDFNASERGDVDSQANGLAYVVVVMDGASLVTNGTDVEQILMREDDASHEVAVHAPVSWRSIPDGAHVASDRP